METQVQITSPKKLGILWIIIGFIAAILACAMFWSLKDQPVQTQSVDTANWQTYRNEEYGFEFKYPEDWKVLNWNDDSIQGRNWEIVALYSPETDINEIRDTDIPSNIFFVHIEDNGKREPGLTDSGWGVSELGGGSFRQVNIDGLFEIKISSLDKHNFEILNQVYSTFKFTK